MPQATIGTDHQQILYGKNEHQISIIWPQYYRDGDGIKGTDTSSKPLECDAIRTCDAGSEALFDNWESNTLVGLVMPEARRDN